MSIPLRVLFAEDPPDDTLLLAAELRMAGYDVTWKRVETRETLRATLNGQKWDIIIADHSMPHLNGHQALEILHETGLDIPYILVSGTVKEEEAIDMMRAGAQDFILKGNLARLLPAVTRELREAEVRHERRLAEEALRKSEERFRTIFSTMSEGFALCEIICNDEGEPVDFRFLEINYAFEKLTGTRHSTVVGRTAGEVLPGLEPLWVERLERVALTGQPTKFDGYIQGLGKHFEVFAFSPAEGQFAAMLLDVTERKLAEQRERELEAHKLEFYRRMLMAVTGEKLVLTEREEVEKLAGPPLKVWDIRKSKDLSAIRQEAVEMARSAGMETDKLYGLMSAIGEATSNAIKFAGGGRASMHRNNSGFLFMVSDNGPGIDPLNMPNVALVQGYSTAGTGGMGYKMIIGSTDKVYLATGPDGTTVAFEVGLRQRAIQPSV